MVALMGQLGTGKLLKTDNSEFVRQTRPARCTLTDREMTYGHRTDASLAPRCLKIRD
jgi:hypothetical protein